MEQRLEIPIPCALSALPETAAVIANFARRHGLSQRIVFALELAIDELGSNIIRHGFKEQAEGARINLALCIEDCAATATFFDNAPAFDPLEDAPAPDTTSNIETRAVGGLGVHLVKSLSDDARYERTDGQNQLTLLWNRKADAQP